MANDPNDQYSGYTQDEKEKTFSADNMGYKGSPWYKMFFGSGPSGASGVQQAAQPPPPQVAQQQGPGLWDTIKGLFVTGGAPNAPADVSTSPPPKKSTKK